jgi:hypothetical protein
MNPAKKKTTAKTGLKFKDLNSRKNPKGGWSGPGDKGPNETTIGSATGGAGAGKIKF